MHVAVLGLTPTLGRVKSGKCAERNGSRSDMPNPIQDEFTNLKMSRQQKYQLRMRRDGRCKVCGDKVAGSSIWCLKHLVAVRERTRKRLGCKLRLTGTKSYRLQERSVARAKRRLSGQANKPQSSSSTQNHPRSVDETAAGRKSKFRP
jgi:hypothetical protein